MDKEEVCPICLKPPSTTVGDLLLRCDIDGNALPQKVIEWICATGHSWKPGKGLLRYRRSGDVAVAFPLPDGKTYVPPVNDEQSDNTKENQHTMHVYNAESCPQCGTLNTYGQIAQHLSEVDQDIDYFVHECGCGNISIISGTVRRGYKTKWYTNINAFLVDEQPARNEVMTFAAEMERALRNNDHKNGWRRDTLDELASMAQIHTENLTESVGELDKENILKYAVNVANFAMFVYDLASAIDALQPEVTVPLEDVSFSVKVRVDEILKFDIRNSRIRVSDSKRDEE